MYLYTVSAFILCNLTHQLPSPIVMVAGIGVSLGVIRGYQGGIVGLGGKSKEDKGRRRQCEWSSYMCAPERVDVATKDDVKAQLGPRREAGRGEGLSM